MRHIAAYLLLQIGGNASPTAADISKLLSTVGIEADESRLETLISELDGKDINALIAEGNSKLASVPSGGGAAVASSGGAAPSGGAATEAPKEEEKKKEEEKEESDDDMGFGLFD
jgi:large subunit ribosomal protein LP2